MLKAMPVLCAYQVGGCEAVFDISVDYSRTRVQFGQPIGDFQMVQQMLANSAMEIEAARLMVLRAAFEVDQGCDARERISMVKVYAAEVLGRVADRAVQIFGGPLFSSGQRLGQLGHLGV